MDDNGTKHISTNVQDIVTQASQYTADALHQLRPVSPFFTGRAAEVEQLVGSLSQPQSQPQPQPQPQPLTADNVDDSAPSHVIRIEGASGVGKTALANVVGHALAGHFPMAQLFVELGASGPSPLTTCQALAQCIRTFEHDPAIRLSDDESSLRGLYLNALDNKRALIILDDACDDAQVASLLPPAGCACIITARRALNSGLSIKLDVLPRCESIEYLLAICPRLTIEEAGALAEICDRLPIALSLAGAYLHCCPIPVQGYIRRVCGVVSTVPAKLATLVAANYRALGVDRQGVLRALSVMPADFDWDAALYVGQAESILDETRALAPDHTLDDLVAHGLLQYDAWAKRFRWHELIRSFVRSHTTAGELDTAAYRHASYYKGILVTSRRLYRQGEDHAALSLHILDREWVHIQVGQSWAAARAEQETNIRESLPATRLCNDYADAGLYALRLRLSARERIRWLAAARAAAHRLRELDAEGAHLVNLGNAYDELCDYRNAVGSYKKALEIVRKIGDPYSEAWVLGSLGAAYKSLNDPRRAIVYFEEKLEINRKIRDRRNEGVTFGCLGGAYADLGDTRLAIESYEQYLAISRELGDPCEEAIASWNLGLVYEQLGDLPRAIAAMQICVAYENEHNHPDAANDATHVAALRARLNSMSYS